MNPLEQRVKELEDKIARLERLLNTQGNTIILNGTVVVNGRINADKVFTQRTGSYVELTT